MKYNQDVDEDNVNNDDVDDDDANDDVDDDNVDQSVSAVDCAREALCSLSRHNVHKLSVHRL